MRCPCRGCQRRQPGCHSKCEGYRAWRAEYDSGKEASRNLAADDVRFQAGLKKEKYIRKHTIKRRR